jgi:hypothetical protein
LWAGRPGQYSSSGKNRSAGCSLQNRRIRCRNRGKNGTAVAPGRFAFQQRARHLFIGGEVKKHNSLEGAQAFCKGFGYRWQIGFLR